jgi:tetratricopeptide (TPR) repeat protein
MTRRLLPWLCVLGAAVWSRVASAADSAAKVAEMQTDVDRVGRRLRDVMKNYENRRGLIGAVEARIRYEDAVYDFLVGHYDAAANSFFVLVRSEALTSTALHHDSQWYLAEALFEIGNYQTSADAYGAIVDAGPTHPYFADAVRRQLEIYGVLRDTERFDDVYQRYIATNQVRSTDLVKYTVAKSFYRQGDHQRAIELLAQVAPDSADYGRARYLAGVVYTADRKLDEAIPHFVAVAQLEPKSSLDRTVVELATMASARLYYETGQYPLAAEAYSRITNESEYFADELYELVWTFIEQDAWSDAVRAVDTFLIAFPDHRYAMELKLLRGHLNVRQQTYADALTAYETVVADYTPMRDRLATIDLDRDDPLAFFDRVVQTGTIDVGNEALPPYATEMLFSSDVMDRARTLHAELGAESADLATSQALIGDIESALAGGSDAIGTFAWGRKAIGELRDEVLRLLAATMSAEVDYLEGNLPEKMRPEVEALDAQVRALTAEAQKAKSEKGAATDRKSAYDSQVKAVQNRAFKVQAVARDLEAQASSVETFLATAKLTPEERASVTRELERTRSELSEAVLELDRLMGDTARRNVLSTVGGAGVGTKDGGRDHGATLAAYTALQSRIAGYRADVASSDAHALFGAADRIWGGLVAVDGEAAVADARLDETQRRELALLKDELATETVHVADCTTALERTKEASAALVARVARYGLAELQREFDDAILRADMGVVDVFWLEKTGVSDEITRLYQERADQLKELDQRYGMIQQKVTGTTPAAGKR